jgi:hypothetical protein
MRVAWVLGLTAAITAAQQVDDVRVSADLHEAPVSDVIMHVDLSILNSIERDGRHMKRRSSENWWLRRQQDRGRRGRHGAGIE